MVRKRKPKLPKLYVFLNERTVPIGFVYEMLSTYSNNIDVVDRSSGKLLASKLKRKYAIFNCAFNNC